jgi:thiol:disulfide interchange protein DsbD
MAAVAFLLASSIASSAASAQKLLDPDVAFRTSVRMVNPGLIEIRYDTAPGYYLYRDRLAFRLEPTDAALGPARLPPGKVKEDEFFGRQVIYRHRTLVRLPVAAGNGHPVTLTADLQGCADIGVCYPPIRRTFELSAPSSRK